MLRRLFGVPFLLTALSLYASNAAANVVPFVLTGEASEVTSSSAKLNGSVNPKGVATAFAFQYGLSTVSNYQFTANGVRLTGSTTQSASVQVADLICGKTYKFRIAAQNSLNNSAFGEQKTFTTPFCQVVSAGQPSITPGTATSGSTFKIVTRLSETLQTGMQVFANFDNGQGGWLNLTQEGGKVLMSCSGTTCQVDRSVSTVGNRSVRVGVFSATGSQVGTWSAAGTFSVTEQVKVNAPQISVISGPENSQVGQQYSIQLRLEDTDSDLKNVEIYWGDNSSVVSRSLSGSSRTEILTYTYSAPGTYSWRATVFDHGSRNASAGRQVTVSNPSISLSQPTVNPTSGVSGSSFRFTLSLSSALPTGHQVYLNFDDSQGGWLAKSNPGGHEQMLCSGVSCQADRVIDTVGSPRKVRAAIFNSSGLLVGNYSITRDFTVTEKATINAPKVTIQSVPVTSVKGGDTLFRFNFSDADGDLKVAQVSWGDGNLSNAVSLNGSSASAEFKNIYTALGSYSWSVTVTDHGGRTSRLTGTIQITQGGTTVSLNSALDNSDLVFKTGGDGGLGWFTQANVVTVGQHAVQSGAIKHSQESWLETTVTGPGVIRFKWKVSSENRFDFLAFMRQGSTVVERISGEAGWVSAEHQIPEGTQRLTWRYYKDTTNNVGQDTAWLDAVEWEPQLIQVVMPDIPIHQCFNRSHLPNGSNTGVGFTEVELQVSDHFIAKAPVYGYAQEGFCLTSLDWYYPSGQPVTDWGSMFKATSANVTVRAKMSNGDMHNLAVVTTTRPALAVEINSDTLFPVLEENPIVSLQASINGGKAPFQYEWKEVREFAIDGFGYFNNHIRATETGLAKIEMPAQGQLYRKHLNDNVTRSPSSLHHIDLKVTDADGKVGYKRFSGAIASAYGRGNPDLSGSGSLLFKGVDVASGNLHLNYTDLSVASVGPAFVVTRAYNTDPVTNNPSWNFNLDMRLQFNPFEAKELQLRREDGRIQSFFKNNDNKWYPLNPGSFDRLVRHTNGDYILYTQGSIFYEFSDPRSDNQGRLNAIADRDGNKVTFNHNAEQQVIGAKDVVGRSYSITRNIAGHITDVSDFTGRNIKYEVDTKGMVTKFTDSRGNATRFNYTNGRLASIVDAKNQTQLAATYHLTGYNQYRLETLADGNGAKWSYLYTTALDENGLHGTIVKQPITNSINNDVVFEIDSSRSRILNSYFFSDADKKRTSRNFVNTTSNEQIGRLALVTNQVDRKGASTLFSFDNEGFGKLTSHVDATGRETRLTWQTLSAEQNLLALTQQNLPGVQQPIKYLDIDSKGRAARIIDPLNNTTKQLFNAKGQIIESINVRGYKTMYNYNSLAQLVEVKDAKGYSQKFEYDLLGRKTSSIDKRGNKTRYEYDLNDNLVKEIDPKGFEYIYVYDELNQLTKSTDFKGNITEYVYDKVGRKITERYLINNSALEKKFEYDALGRVVKTANEDNAVSTNFYDRDGRVTQTVNPVAAVTKYSYDLNGNVVQVTDAMDRKINYEYDQLNRKVKMTSSEGITEHYLYNEQGLLAETINSLQQSTRYKYDLLGRLIEVIDADGGSSKAEYDANDNVIKTIDRSGSIVSYSYDELDQMTQMIDAQQRKWFFLYNEDGQLVSESSPGAGSNKKYKYGATGLLENAEVDNNVAYSYDANSNRIGMKDHRGETLYSYDALDRMVEMKDPLGNIVKYQYDVAGNIKRLTYPGSKTVEYTYDKANHLISVQDWLGHKTVYERDKNGVATRILYGNGTEIRKTFDSAGRLKQLQNLSVSADVISNQQFTLDTLGRPTSVNAVLPLLPTNFGRSAELIYDKSHRLTSINNVAVQHDEDGRLVSDPSGIDPITYAYNARDLITSVRRGNVETDQYDYDGDGRRISRMQGVNKTHYVNDALGGIYYRLLAESDAKHNPQYFYIYGEGLISQIHQSEHRYYHFDQMGNTLALTDSKGQVTDRYAYEPFGNTTAEGRSHNPFRFVGQYGVMDDGNGLHHMRARYYRPDIRRFVSLDAVQGEIKDPFTLNRYQYVGGNPMVGVDPSGYFYDDCNDYVSNFCESLGRELHSMVDFSNNNLKPIVIDVADVYFVDPAKEIMADCQSASSGYVSKFNACVGDASAKLIATGLDSVNPFTAAKVAARSLAREIAGGDKKYEEDMIAISNLVFDLASIRGLSKNTVNYKAKIDVAKKLYDKLVKRKASGSFNTKTKTINKLGKEQEVLWREWQSQILEALSSAYSVANSLEDYVEQMGK